MGSFGRRWTVLAVGVSCAALVGAGTLVVRSRSSAASVSAIPSVWSPPLELPQPVVTPVTSATPATTPAAEKGLPSVMTLTGRADAGTKVLSFLHIKQRAVFITIDDGYVRDARVLALIRATHLPVTAFLTEQAVNARPLFWTRMARAGVRIENHTVWHPNLRRLRAPLQQVQICAPQSRFHSLFGRSPELFRPPYGAFNPATLRAVRACGLRSTILWDATFSRGKLSTWGGRGLRPGDIVLLHFRPTLYRDLVALIAKLRAKHLGVGSLEDFLYGSSRAVALRSPAPSPRASASPSASPVRSRASPS